jgi:hypothetical protein
VPLLTEEILAPRFEVRELRGTRSSTESQEQVNVERVVGSSGTSIASRLHKDVTNLTRTQ